MTALEYNKGRNYSSAQIEMIQRTVGVAADGIWGPDTIAGVEQWQRTKGLSADGKVGPQTLVAIFVDARTADPGLFPITRVGVWSGQSSLNNPNDDTGFCRDNGISDLYVVVNDFSAKRTAQPFSTFTRSKIVTLAQAARAAGVRIHLMSWIMPHGDFIQGAADSLVPLCDETGAASLQWDAEEPWNQAEGGLPYEEAASRVHVAFASLSCPMGVTGIGYTSTEKFGPLSRVCSTLVPQCYATSGGSLSPETAVSTCVDRWRSKDFGARGAQYLVGLAAYKQSGIAGHTVESAMTACLDNTRAYQLDTVIYWSLRQIKDSPEVTAVIRSIRNAGG